MGQPGRQHVVAHPVQVAARLAQGRLDQDQRAAAVERGQRAPDKVEPGRLVELVHDAAGDDQIEAGRFQPGVAQQLGPALDRDATVQLPRQVSRGPLEDGERGAVAVHRGDREIDGAPGAGQISRRAQGHGAGAGAQVEQAQRGGRRQQAAPVQLGQRHGHLGGVGHAEEERAGRQIGRLLGADDRLVEELALAGVAPRSLDHRADQRALGQRRTRQAGLRRMPQRLLDRSQEVHGQRRARAGASETVALVPLSAPTSIGARAVSGGLPLPTGGCHTLTW